MITEKTLSECYELDVKMQAVEDYPYMVFRNSADKEGVKLVF